MSFDLKITNGDLSINNGDLDLVIDTDKLKQDLVKVILTESGANPLWPQYGSLINRTLIGSYLSSDVIFSMAEQQIINSIENLKKLQEEQVKTLQKISPSEQIYALSSVSVNRNNIDYRLIEVAVKVISRSLTTVEANFKINS